jgi:hypothetical protein
VQPKAPKVSKGINLAKTTSSDGCRTGVPAAVVFLVIYINIKGLELERNQKFSRGSIENNVQRRVILHLHSALCTIKQRTGLPPCIN